jgi:putative zinc finger protein
VTVDEADREPALREYLLGGLAPAQREEIEERLLADPDVHAAVQATGDDLIHAYLAGELSAADRERFETHFLSTPRRRERVAFVRTLVSAVDRVGHGASRPTGAHAVPPAPRRSISVVLPWAAALVVGLGAGGWSLSERRLRQQAAAQAKQVEENLRQELATRDRRLSELELAASAPTDGIAIWRLREGLERGPAREDAFIVRADSEYVRLRLPLARDPGKGSLRASLQDANGKELDRVPALQARSGPGGVALDIVVSAGLLRPGAAYVLIIRPDAGGDEITATSFFVR